MTPEKQLAEIDTRLAELRAERGETMQRREKLLASPPRANRRNFDATAAAIQTHNAAVAACDSILNDLDDEIDEMEQQREVAAHLVAKAKAATIADEIAGLDADIESALDGLEALLENVRALEMQRATVLGKVAHPSGRYDDIQNKIRTHRLNVAASNAILQVVKERQR